MLHTEKQSFKLQSSIGPSVDVFYAEVTGTYARVSHCVSRVRLLRVVALPQTRGPIRRGEMLDPSRRGVPYWDELGSVEPLGSKGKQGIAPKSSVLYKTEGACKQGLLVATATVKGFDKPWSILIDSGASGDYA